MTKYISNTSWVIS